MLLRCESLEPPPMSQFIRVDSAMSELSGYAPRPAAKADIARAQPSTPISPNGRYGISGRSRFSLRLDICFANCTAEFIV